jgi:hypothetical protein
VPSPLDADTDARLLRWGWLAFAAWTVIGGVLLAGGLLEGGEAIAGIAFVAPLWAAWLLWLLWRCAANARHWAARRAWGEWHGSYFEFDGRQVRVVFEEDDIYLAAEDVFDVIGTDGHGRAPERVQLIAGRDALIELAERGLLVFTERGLRAWMHRRTETRATKFMVWLDNEVVAPYRKMRRAQRLDAVHET